MKKKNQKNLKKGWEKVEKSRRRRVDKFCDFLTKYQQISYKKVEKKLKKRLRKSCKRVEKSWEVEKKLKTKLTSVSFMYVCVAENGEMLVFFSFFFPTIV